jgi:hypothetical protein
VDLAKIGMRGRLGEPHVRTFPRSSRRGSIGALLLYFLGNSPLGAAAQATSPSAVEPMGHGPLTWEEGNPLHRLAYAPGFEGAGVTPAGELTADLWLGFSNLFEQDSSQTHVVFLDTERLLSALTVRWGAAERLEIGGRLTFETTGPGFLDSFVHWYHETLSFGQANRDRFPGDRYSQRLTDGGATRYADLERRTLGLADVQLFAKWSATDPAGSGGALALKAVARVPTRANRVAAERADAGLVALGRLGNGPWFLHAMVGAGLVRAPPELDAVLRDANGFLGIAVERTLGSSVSAVVQYQLATPMLMGFEHRELDWPSSNLVLGAAGRWGEDWSWDASFQEDLPADTPAIDFTLGLRVSRRWR